LNPGGSLAGGGGPPGLIPGGGMGALLSAAVAVWRRSPIPIPAIKIDLTVVFITVCDVNIKR
jgi:hypothetical protein